MGEDAGATTDNLPPGFGFFPSDEELVRHYLQRKASMLHCGPDIIPTLHLPHLDPWNYLHCKALKGGKYWYFFSHITENKTTPNGYWKQIGVDEAIKDVGLKKTLVFHSRNQNEGIKTNWIMHEFFLIDKETKPCCSNIIDRKPSKKRGQHKALDANKWVVCRVYEAGYNVQSNSHEDGMELSCLDEIYMSFDDYDEVSLTK